MPTMNPRVQVTLSPSLDALVRQLAVHQRASKSQVLRELLEAAEPALRRAVALMDAASKASEELRSGFGKSLDQAQVRAEKALASTLATMDSATADLVSLAEEVRSRRPARMPRGTARAAPTAPRNPPASNRGVKSHRRGGEEEGKPLAARKKSGGRA